MAALNDSPEGATDRSKRVCSTVVSECAEWNSKVGCDRNRNTNGVRGQRGQARLELQEEDGREREWGGGASDVTLGLRSRLVQF